MGQHIYAHTHTSYTKSRIYTTIQPEGFARCHIAKNDNTHTSVVRFDTFCENTSVVAFSAPIRLWQTCIGKPSIAFICVYFQATRYKNRGKQKPTLLRRCWLDGIAHFMAAEVSGFRCAKGYRVLTCWCCCGICGCADNIFFCYTHSPFCSSKLQSIGHTQLMRSSAVTVRRARWICIIM